MSTVLVTGGSGFMGTNLVRFHCERGDSVCNVDIAAPRDGRYRPNWIEADIRDQGGMAAIVGRIKPDFVYHLAARTDLDGKSLADYSSNTLGVESLIAALEAGCPGVKRVVYASTRFVCSIGHTPKDEHDYCPDTFYGESKVVGEQIVRDRGGRAGEWTIVRPTSIWGPWFGTPFHEFFRAIGRGVYVHPARTRIFKSLGYVGNTVFELHRIMAAPAQQVAGRMFYVADYEPVEIGAFADGIRAAFGGGRVLRVPLGLLRAAALAGDASRHLGIRHPPLTSYRLGNMTTDAVHDVSALRPIVGDLPYSLQEGIRETVRWVRERTG